MSSFDTFTAPVNGISPAELARAQAQLASREAAHKATMGPQVKIASMEQVNIQGGVITSAQSNRRDGSGTAYVNQVKPGFIEIPGMGQTSIEAAKAGGLIPYNRVEGQVTSGVPMAPPMNHAMIINKADHGLNGRSSSRCPTHLHPRHCCRQ